MGFIKNIMSNIDEYKAYISSGNSNALTTAKSKNRNLFTYISMRNFKIKYGDALYKHFKIRDDFDAYEFLIKLFGKKNIENALNIEGVTTAEIADKFLKLEDVEMTKELQKNWILNEMRDCISFNRATGLNLSEFEVGIQPQYYSRKLSNNKPNETDKTMLNIFEENKVTKNVLKEIYDMYGKEIITCYNRDLYLRNKSVLRLDDKYKEEVAVGGLQDHVTYYSEEDFDSIFQKYFNDAELSKTEQYILIGLLAKESDLIGIYTVEHLRKHSEYIKSEIDVGIFDDIVVSGKQYKNDERKKIATLSKVWRDDDLKRYNNLGLLKQRLESLPQTQDIIDTIHTIDEIQSKELNEVVTKSTEIADFMDSAFMDYEIENRNQILENVYNPKKKEVVITDLSQLSSSAMLHFFDPSRKMSNFDDYVKNIEEKRSKELGKKFEFSEDEKSKMLLQYQAKEDHYITDYALDLENVGQVGSFNERYVTNTSNQLCTMIITPKEILEGNGTRGRIALGFSKETLNPELIVTISNKNIHSNKGIDYVESDNPFKDFSASYDELISNKKARGDNTEVVLFRNSYQASLKPSYVMYIGERQLNSEEEMKNIESIKKQMEEAGVNIPLVIFDKFSIREKMKNEQLELNQDDNIER